MRSTSTALLKAIIENWSSGRKPKWEKWAGARMLSG